MNLIRLSLRALLDRKPSLKRAMIRRFPDFLQNESSHIGENKFDQFRDEVSRIYEWLGYNPQEDLDNSTMDELFDKLPDQKRFLAWFACTRTWADSVDCAELSRIDSIQDRVCTTLMHKGAMVYDSFQKPQVFDPVKLASGYQIYFDAKDVIKIMLDFRPEDYGDLKRQIGARLLFHDPSQVSSATQVDFYVTRGYKYDFTIDREDVKLLREPYNGCVEYSENLADFRLGINPRLVTNHETCFQNCFARSIIDQAGCFPPTVPYYRNDSLDPGLDIKSCTWFSGLRHTFVQPEIIRKARLKDQNKTNVDMAEILSQLYTKKKRECMRKCDFSCRITSFSVSVSRSVWPTDSLVAFDESGLFKTFRHCCALISIKYANYHYTLQDFKPKYNLMDTIGNVGGLLAVWLSLSIVSVYKAIHKTIEICRQRTC